jgi:hypothetical protein
VSQAVCRVLEPSYALPSRTRKFNLRVLTRCVCMKAEEAVVEEYKHPVGLPPLSEGPALIDT